MYMIGSTAAVSTVIISALEPVDILSTFELVLVLESPVDVEPNLVSLIIDQGRKPIVLPIISEIYCPKFFRPRGNSEGICLEPPEGKSTICVGN
jgi:hypothetical protein